MIRNNDIDATKRKPYNLGSHTASYVSGSESFNDL